MEQKWSGYYEQGGQQYSMEIQNFYLSGVQVLGSGSDSIGQFDINGLVSDNNQTSRKVEFVKQYRGQHAVNYVGEYSDNLCHGTWSVGGSTGGFRLERVTPQPVFTQQPMMQPLIGQPVQQQVIIQGGAYDHYDKGMIKVHSVHGMELKCQYCGHHGHTEAHAHNSQAAWGCCIFMCCFGCALCCCVPFCMDDCKDADHTCRNCHRMIAQKRVLEQHHGKTHGGSHH